MSPFQHLLGLLRLAAGIALILFLLPPEPVRSESVLSSGLKLKTIYNSEHVLSDLLEENDQGLVLYFMHDTCPVVQLYLPRLQELHEEFAPQGIRLVGVYANRGDNTFSMATHAAQKDIPYLVLYDKQQALLDLLHVERTCTAVVIDPQGRVRFKGPVDDQFTKGRAKTNATKPYLRTAIESLLAGDDGELVDVPVSGCVITRHAKADRTAKTPDAPTFHRDVLPIFQKHCQVCHRPGEAAPFSLLSYEDASNWSAMIGEVVEERRMPPWRVVSNHALANDEHLSASEVATVAAWSQAGAPEGDAADAPAAREWPKETRWKIGQPAWEYEFDKAFTVPASGAVEYQYFPIRNPFPDRDRWITAVETAPGNKRVVHHIQVHVVKSLPGAQKLDPLTMMALFGFSADNANLIGGYAVGDQYSARVLPPGYAMRLPAGHDLVMEMHYTPSGKPEQDRSRIAFQFTDTPPERELKSRFLHRKIGRFSIPAGAMHHRMETDYWFEKTTKLHSVRPHMHTRGKQFQLDLVYPAGRRFAHLTPPVSDVERTETILWAPNYDFNWQRTYEFKQPLIIPAGAELRGIAHFDNSRFNPGNPDPTVDVPWGQQVYHEMFAVKFFYEDAEDSEYAPQNPELTPVAAARPVDQDSTDRR